MNKNQNYITSLTPTSSIILHHKFLTMTMVGGLVEGYSEQILVMRQYLLIVIFVSGFVVRTDMRACYNSFHFLENLASFAHDGVKVLLELLYKGCIVVVYLLDDKGIDVPSIIDVDAVMRLLI